MRLQSLHCNKCQKTLVRQLSYFCREAIISAPPSSGNNTQYQKTEFCVDILKHLLTERLASSSKQMSNTATTTANNNAYVYLEKLSKNSSYSAICEQAVVQLFAKASAPIDEEHLYFNLLRMPLESSIATILRCLLQQALVQ